jgi:tRNA dimethylallyltransferase
LQKVIVIVGPTASGKTKYAVEKAKSIGGEIINCDSLQVYNDLRILTSFPKEEETFGVKHKLFGYLNYDEKISAVSWARSAASEIKKTFHSGKVPIIVGGTGLYIKTLIEGISPIPEISHENRKTANSLAKTNFQQLQQTLYNLAPELKEIFTSKNHRQLIRAYEIFLETGKSIKYFTSLPKIEFIKNVEFDINLLEPERNELYQRINSRFELMLKSGAIEEIESLLQKMNLKNRMEIFKKYPIFNAIGAKEITLYLDGIYSFEKMKEVSMMNSRHYAKRQITWFKHQL